MGNPETRLQTTTRGRAENLRAGLLAYEDALPLARRAQALSDPGRLALLKLLGDAGEELCVSDICVITEREQAGVSRHLRVLWDAGVVQRRSFNRWALYKPSAAGKRLLAALLASEE